MAAVVAALTALIGGLGLVSASGAAETVSLGGSLDLMNASSDEAVMTISDNTATIEPAVSPADGYGFSFVGAPPETESMRFVVSGPIDYRRVENVAPYSAFGNRGPDHWGRTLVPGVYTIEVEAFAANRARGVSLGSQVFSFEVLDGATTTTPPPTTPSPTTAPPTTAPPTIVITSTTVAPSTTAELTTTVAPSTTVQPTTTIESTTTTAAPPTTVAPTTTAAPSTTAEPTTTAPPTTVAPTTTAAPPTTAAPTTTVGLPPDVHPDIVKVIEVSGRNPGGVGWMDSYSVDDRCYCATTFDHDIGDIEVDTPAGRKTVREVCEKIGDGPGIQGRPIYNDIQCGNGPANNAGDEDDCPGRVDIGRRGCGHIGPKWDLSGFD